jgi:hypothetical protein
VLEHHALCPNGEASLSGVPPRQTTRSRGRLVTLTVVLAGVGFLLAAPSGGARGTVSAGRPAIPACFRKVGYCEGFTFTTVPTLKEVVHSGNVFALVAPRHPQTTKPVANGEIPTYNHFSWGGVGGSFTAIVAGCAVNADRCKVKLPATFHGWVPVVWQLNNDRPVVFLLLNGS